MDRILLNQKTVNLRKALKKNQKDSIRDIAEVKAL